MKFETEYLKERAIAYLIDYITIFLIMSIGLMFITIATAFGPEMSEEEYNRFFNFLVYASFWVVSFGYFIIAEWKFSTTLGKMICIIGISNESDLEGDELKRITLKQSMIRNFSKMRAELMLLDIIVGLYIKPSKIRRAGSIVSKTMTVEIPDPLAKNTKQSKKVRRAFKIVMAIGGALALSLHVITDLALILDLIT
ncbi:MAG: RDD family protein [Candidatus Hodarchaeales archaeon]|jgi:uncharacterized RDD family membrane protein YckC